MRLPKHLAAVGLLLAVCIPALHARGSGPSWMCITRPIFADPVAKLADARSLEGFAVRIIITDDPQDQLKHLPETPDYLLLVGDDEPGQAHQPWYVPARRVDTYRWGAHQPVQYASDLAWADSEGKGRPRFPVGRIPVRTAAQATAVIDKILAYEKQAPSVDQLTLPVMAGAANYNAMLDHITTGILVAAIRTYCPQWAEPWIVSGNPTSVFCGWPPDQLSAYTDKLAGRPALACFIGHGRQRSFFFLPWRGHQFWYRADLARSALADGAPSGPAIIVACLTGKFTDTESCLAESLLYMQAGPVATVAATRESHPLPNYFSGVSLLKEAGNGHTRLGDFWLASQNNMLEARNLIVEGLLFDSAGRIDRRLDQHELRNDQLLMYVILGDPATRLKLPAKLHGTVTRSPGRLDWTIEKPAGATELQVHFRPAGQKLPRLDGRFDAETRRRLHAEANAVFEFEPVATLTADQPWQGSWDSPGLLRLVAIGPERMHVTTLRLDPPPVEESAVPESVAR